MLTVLIPTHGRPELLSRTLDSLAECELPLGYRGLVVIENGSRSGAELVVGSLPPSLRASYLHYEDGNKSAALNHALRTIPDEDLVVFFDDDVRLSRSILCDYTEAASRNPRAFFGGPVECDYESSPPRWISLPRSATGWRYEDSEVNSKEPTFLGFNWAAFAAHLRECGGFDPRVGPGGTTGARGQETLMQSRLRDRGYSPQYVPQRPRLALRAERSLLGSVGASTFLSKRVRFRASTVV